MAESWIWQNRPIRAVGNTKLERTKIILHSTYIIKYTDKFLFIFFLVWLIDSSISNIPPPQKKKEKAWLLKKFNFHV